MIEEELVFQAVQALRDLNKRYCKGPSKKKKLLDDEEGATVFLQLSLHKIPRSKGIKMIKVNLPHRILRENSEVCLITGDLDKHNRKAEIEPDIRHYKNLLEQHGIKSISEIVTLRQLRTDYKPYEAKQKLLAAYDFFLTDKKITGCLPNLLGRHFFKKRKFPVQIDIKTSNLKQQVDKALSTTVLYLTAHGNSCASEVATLDMSDSDISENVSVMIKTLSDQLPGACDNIKGIYLKTALSKGIPLYISYGNPNEIRLKQEKVDNSAVVGELSTIPGLMVHVYRDGRIKTSRIRDDESDNENMKIEKAKGKNEERVPDNKILNNEESMSVELYKDAIEETESKNESQDYDIRPGVKEMETAKSEMISQKSKVNEDEMNVNEMFISGAENSIAVAERTRSKQNRRNKKIQVCSAKILSDLNKEDPAEVIKKSEGKLKRKSSLLTNEEGIASTRKQHSKKVKKGRN